MNHHPQQVALLLCTEENYRIVGASIALSASIPQSTKPCEFFSAPEKIRHAFDDSMTWKVAGGKFECCPAHGGGGWLGFWEPTRVSAIPLLSSTTPTLSMLLLIDNYDSFTWNLVQAFGVLDSALAVQVVRNDAMSAAAALALRPQYLVISPGPCTPRESGISCELIAKLRGEIPILGVCLGHQAIGDVHGMSVVRNDRPVHGKTSPIFHDGRGLFAGVNSPTVATRYHSLIVERASVTSDFEISAWTDRDEVMGLRWKAPAGNAPLEGVQFHPESFLSVDGPTMLGNFLKMGR